MKNESAFTVSEEGADPGYQVGRDPFLAEDRGKMSGGNIVEGSFNIKEEGRGFVVQPM